MHNNKIKYTPVKLCRCFLMRKKKLKFLQGKCRNLAVDTRQENEYNKRVKGYNTTATKKKDNIKKKMKRIPKFYKFSKTKGV